MRAAQASIALFSALCLGAGSYQASIEQWRKDREKTLKAPEGWLAVAGLFWLKEGENRAGSDAANEIMLPAGRSPARLGVFDFHAGKTGFRVASGAHVMVNGMPVLTADLKPDSDLLQSGDFTMFVIKRGGRYAIRMRDLHSQMREEFRGMRWYPVKEQYRVVADFISYHQPHKIPIANVLGQTESQPSPGYAQFRLAGHSYRLEPVTEGDQLFFIFRDQTAQDATYGAGRFLYADLPKEGKVVLDFNKAVNPPCAFTAFATCPLPPKQNRLTVRIEAGELRYVGAR